MRELFVSNSSEKTTATERFGRVASPYTYTTAHRHHYSHTAAEPNVIKQTQLPDTARHGHPIHMEISLYGVNIH